MFDVSVYLNGVDITATAGALVIHDTDIKADLGDYSGQTNLRTLLAALGIPDTAGKALYTCLVTDRLDNSTYGLSPLQVLLAAIPTTAMRGTENAALASAWTAALATALANYTEVRAGYIDNIYIETQHRSMIFPDLSSNIALTCTFTSGVADTFGTWAEVTDSGATTFSSLLSAIDGHVSALRIRSLSADDKLYAIELGYGPDASTVTIFDAHEFGSGTKKIDSDQTVRFRSPKIPAGQRVYYRMKTEDTINATATIGLRYHLDT